MRTQTVSILLSVLLLAPAAHAGKAYLNGAVSASSVDRLLKTVEKLHAKGDRDIRVTLKSNGGDLQAAYRAYLRLKEIGVDTNADDECSSSCTMIYAAGKRRSASTGTKFMFHPVRVKVASGVSKERKAQLQKEIDIYITKYSQLWLSAVRAVDQYLAWELEKDRILVNGKDRYYNVSELRRTGYVNQ